MIGYKKNLTGRMGNRLFQYHFMKQLSFKLEIDTFHKNIPDSIWFEDMNEKRVSWNIFRRKIKYTSKDIQNLGKENFLKDIKQSIQKNKLIVLEPSILGELFYEYLFINPNECIKIKEQFRVSDISNDFLNVAIHFRGTDFESWNKDAILDTEYYINSIESITENNKLKFYLFSDDLNLDSYLKTINYLKENNLDFILGDISKEAIYDFYTMSCCDIIISSPSTFSIWAGILGKRKKIIHSEKWIQNRIEENDKFWIDLNNTDNEIYRIWRKI